MPTVIGGSILTRSTWIVGLGSLTPQQRQVVSLGTRTNQLIFGPAGSGKTLLLLHRAQHLIRANRLPADRVRMFVYTNVLKSYVSSGVESLGLPHNLVQSFYTWIGSLARQFNVRVNPTAENDDQYLAKLRAVLAYVESAGVTPILDAALVDEGQDLPAEAYQLLCHLAKHVTVFADYSQRLFDHGAHVSEIARLLDVSKESQVLLNNHRNSRDVAKLAGRFLPVPEADQYLRTQSVVTIPSRRNIPVLFRGRNSSEEWDFLAGVIKREVQKNRRVGILVPINYLVYLTHKELTARGVNVTKLEKWHTNEVDFNDLTPKVMTVYGAKGLTFDTVIMPQLIQRWYAQSHSEVAPLLFVGITRACDWVCLSTTVGSELPELSRLSPLIQAKCLVERNNQAVVAHPAELIEDDLEDLPI